MACDRFVRFPKKTHPGSEMIGKLLTEYLGNLVTEPPTFEDSRWMASLRGPSTVPATLRFPEIPRESYAETRWIEVYVDVNQGYADIITRRADEATSALAQGFAEMLARLYSGTLEDS